MPTLILAIDVGTTNVKSVLFNERGEALRASVAELTLLTGPGGAAEHDPRELLQAVRSTSKLAAKGERVDVVALSFYQHGLMLADSEGRPLTNILTHLDTRAARQAAWIEASGPARELYVRTGCPPLFVYALPKAMWLARTRPEIVEKARWFLVGKDLVTLHLTGEPYIDYGNASGSQLFNISQLRWDDKALEVAGLDEDRLARPVEGAAVLDSIEGEKLGFRGRAELVLGTFDGACQNFGYLLTSSDRVAINLGTTAVMRALTQTPVLDPAGMRIFCYYAAAGFWSSGGSTNNGGSVLRWLRDALGEPEKRLAAERGVSPYEVLVEEAGSSPPGSRGLLFLPFMAGERFPFRDPYARGSLLGLSYEHGKPDIIRAFLEGVAFTLRAILDALVASGLKPREAYGAGGGFRSRLWAEIVASAVGLPVYRVREAEYASSRGAACLALLALGHAKRPEDLGWRVEVDELVEPDDYCRLVYDESYSRFKKAYEALSGFYRWLGDQQHY